MALPCREACAIFAGHIKVGSAEVTLAALKAASFSQGDAAAALWQPGEAMLQSQILRTDDARTNWQLAIPRINGHLPSPHCACPTCKDRLLVIDTTWLETKGLVVKVSEAAAWLQ